MQKHDDGSVTLTKREVSELNKAYQGLYDILSDMPSAMEDYFSTKSEVMKIRKWQAQLNGEKFNRKDWE